MRTYKRSRGARPYKTNYTEDNLQRAIDAVKRGTSVGKAGTMFNVPKSTLQRKVKGKGAKKHGGQLAVSAENEVKLSKIINQVALWSVPFDSLDIRHLVKHSLDKEGAQHRIFRDNLPGIDWLKGFMKRHNLTLRQADKVKPKRYEVTEESVNSFYSELTEALQDVPMSNIYNFDETNLTDDPKNHQVVVRRGFKRVISKTVSSKAGFSVMFCGNASGEYLPPMVVYKAVASNVYERWIKGGPPGTLYGSTPSGWFNMNMFEQWFMQIFLPNALERTGRKVLIGDNLACHFSEDVLEACSKNNIIFFTLPPNSTHILQPLDVAVFAPLKRLWRDTIASWRAEARSLASVSKQIFPTLLNRAFSALKAENLVAGFRATGIFPLDREKGLRNLPSRIALSESSLDSAAVEILKQHCQQSSSNKKEQRGKRLNKSPGGAVTATSDIEEDDEIWVCHWCQDAWQMDDNRWIECGDCRKRYHLQCSGVQYSRREYYDLDIEGMEFKCDSC